MFPETITILQKLTYFTFVFTFFGMSAGTLYFAVGHNSIHPRWKPAILVSASITFVAALTYFYMKDVYLYGLQSGKAIFPTEFRYIDWFITVPLLLIKFPILLGLGKKGIAFMNKLIILALLMLAFSFIGELNINTDKTVHYTAYFISCAFMLTIIILMGSALKQLPPSAPESVTKSVRRIYYFILLGWVIYPIGFIVPTIGVEADWRELIYNIGDLINKVGLGLVIVAGSYANRKEDALRQAQQH
jgi:sensory rhodopsin